MTKVSQVERLPTLCDHPSSHNPARSWAEAPGVAARRYAAIAPAAPHALHMPAHIFVRLGLWEENIRSNIASREAAESELKQERAGAEALLHAFEFLEYGYLQVGDTARAEAIKTAARAVRPDQVDARYANYYATAQARYAALFAVETQDWAGALRLVPDASTPWTSQQVVYLAHAIAAGHMRDAQAAQRTVEAIEGLVAKTAPPPEGRRTVIDEIIAWSDFAKGDVQRAISRLEPIAQNQAKTGKGEIELPAREMIASMLLLSGQTEAALTQFKSSLAVDPNRFNALLGAAKAAEKLGKMQEAAGYYRTLLKNCPEANGALGRLLDPARTFLNVARRR
jgi:tetratricopeptide (TPR) repeat protein